MIRGILLVLAAVFLSPSMGMAKDSGDPLGTAAAAIDRLLGQRHARDGVTPARLSTDVEFCRRIWLDLAGVAPPISEIRSFLADSRGDKRARLIDRLLCSHQHANHMATRWTEILLPAQSQTEFQQRERVSALQRWLRQQFLDNTPYDHFVGAFLTAEGRGNRGPAVFYTSRGLEPEKIAAATSRIFMGLQLQCAQCHDHPFDDWSRQDFWQYAAFFSQLEQSDANPNASAIIEDRPGGELTIPETDDLALPRYPGIDQPPEKDPQGVRRRQLTIWLASRDNPYFARAAVNRVWEHLFGRGLVDPVDAMDRENAPSHPELLNYLAGLFVDQRFDLHKLYGTVCRTKAYGRSSERVDANDLPADSFAAMSVKTLSATQFFDSLQQNVFRQVASIDSNAMNADSALRDQFVGRMRASQASARDYPHGVVQVLGIMNGPEISAAIDPNRIGLLATLEAPFLSDADRIETLFLATLSRPPTDQESERFSEFFEDAKTPGQRRIALSDLLWVLLNTSECAVAP